jgi:hypothetical protein
LNASLNRRTLRKPAVKAIAASGMLVSSIRRLATWTLRVEASSVGVAPAWRRNRRSMWRGPTPSFSANAPTEPRSRKPSSIRRMPRATVVAVPCQAGLPGAVSGRQRRHGRKPARSAAAAVGKNTTFLDFAGLTGQTGRQ